MGIISARGTPALPSVIPNFGVAVIPNFGVAAEGGTQLDRALPEQLDLWYQRPPLAFPAKMPPQLSYQQHSWEYFALYRFRCSCYPARMIARLSIKSMKPMHLHAPLCGQIKEARAKETACKPGGQTAASA